LLPAAGCRGKPRLEKRRQAAALQRHITAMNIVPAVVNALFAATGKRDPPSSDSRE